MYFAADAAGLPVAPSSVDLIWSNLAWHWFVDPKAVLAEWYRAIRPDGLLMFSAFGVDTLRELRAAGARLPAFPDMHDIGDALGAAGFADPVMDSERLTITWSDAEVLIEEIRALGGNALRGRGAGLRSRADRLRWAAAVEALRGADGRIALSFELVYGHAWCPPRKRLTGRRLCASELRAAPACTAGLRPTPAGVSILHMASVPIWCRRGASV